MIKLFFKRKANTSTFIVIKLETHYVGMGGIKESDKKNNLSHKITIQDSKGQEGLEEKKRQKSWNQQKAKH